MYSQCLSNVISTDILDFVENQLNIFKRWHFFLCLFLLQITEAEAFLWKGLRCPETFFTLISKNLLKIQFKRWIESKQNVTFIKQLHQPIYHNQVFTLQIS